MDDTVSMHDLLNQGTSLSIMHCPNLFDPSLIRLLKVLILQLSVLEPSCELLVILGQFLILILEVLLFT